jgi:hypothetical protein
MALAALLTSLAGHVRVEHPRQHHRPQLLHSLCPLRLAVGADYVHWALFQKLRAATGERGEAKLVGDRGDACCVFHHVELWPGAACGAAWVGSTPCGHNSRQDADEDIFADDDDPWGVILVS